MSKFIEWTNDLSVGVDELDAQPLIEIINELHEAIHNRKGSTISREVLTKLKEYTRVHFAVEESLMRIFKYPRYKEHVKEHAILIDQLIELEDKLDHNKTSISFELSNSSKEIG
ncbi:MAG: bacteriohemerythrin [Candidatus Competibacter sp.]